MNEIEETSLVDGLSAAGLEERGWDRVEADPADPAVEDGKAKKGDPALDAYIINQVQQYRPRRSEEYSDPRRPMPHPCMQPVDSPLLSNPYAWVCAGISVLYVVWHLIPLLQQQWQKKGFGGKPPCPHCYEHAVQISEGRQLTVGQCHQQLPPQEVQQLRKDGKLGKVCCHGWLRTPYRAAGVGRPELLLAYQYRCQGCPGRQLVAVYGLRKQVLHWSVSMQVLQLMHDVFARQVLLELDWPDFGCGVSHFT
jgi:hypothetical protein